MASAALAAITCADIGGVGGRCMALGAGGAESALGADGLAGTLVAFDGVLDSRAAKLRLSARMLKYDSLGGGAFGSLGGGAFTIGLPGGFAFSTAGALASLAGASTTGTADSSSDQNPEAASIASPSVFASSGLSDGAGSVSGIRDPPAVSTPLLEAGETGEDRERFHLLLSATCGLASDQGAQVLGPGAAGVVNGARGGGAFGKFGIQNGQGFLDCFHFIAILSKISIASFLASSTAAHH